VASVEEMKSRIIRAPLSMVFLGEILAQSH